MYCRYASNSCGKIPFQVNHAAAYWLATVATVLDPGTFSNGDLQYCYLVPHIGVLKKSVVRIFSGRRAESWSSIY